MLESPILPNQKERIVSQLTDWYLLHKRELPWRGADPYGIWVSEIMLQQTQVTTVIPYYRRFLERFPTVFALAEAPTDELLRLWAGLGYYARARNLHATARIVVEKYGGLLPSTVEEIERLPGIGRYTAGAILSIAYNIPRPLVDANVIRVLSRLICLEGDPKSAVNTRRIWQLAEALVPEKDPGDFNQGLMELGALICESADPRCELCPLLPDCCAGNSSDPTAYLEYPMSRAAPKIVHSSAILLDGAGKVLIMKRPPHGLWGGLWEFPRAVCLPGELPAEAAVRAIQELLGREAVARRQLGIVKHSVTRYRISLYSFLMETLSEAPIKPLPENAEVLWQPVEHLSTLAFSAPQNQLCEQLMRYLAEDTAFPAQERFSFDAE